jgi:cellulose synthase/poly-beta-1,6-N-acetylglucosamine synthase-like glycosyltransferase
MTSVIIEILLCLFALLILVPVSVFFLQVLMALPSYRPRELPGGRRPTITVLIPAHNEALMIADTLRVTRLQLIAGDRLLVVADNCSDDTAEIAASAGAEVIERKDSGHIGKGYALDFGVRHLESNPSEVVIVIDADCSVDGGTIERLARLCLETGRPVQALYLMHAPEGAGLKMRVAEFSWLVINQVRPLGYHRLGLPCQLDGTGMAFTWSCISHVTLASGHIVEDLLLGVNLARSGTLPLFCPEAVVRSYFPSSAKGMQDQRTRWEHGHLGMILSDMPSLLVDALRRRDCNILALAFDLSVPPLALLTLLILSMVAASTAFIVITKISLPLWLTTIALAMVSAAVLLSWGRYGRRIISLANLAYAPFYALCKMPLYVRFLVRRQVKWVRSKRKGDD